MKMRILIADDHKLFRQGLIGLINSHDDQVEVIGQAESGHEAIRMAEFLRPDVILMDIFMRDGDGFQALATIRKRFPNIAIVMLTSSENKEHLYKAVQLGAAGYIHKNLDAHELFDLLSGIQKGEAAMTKAMASRLLRGIAQHSTEKKGEELLTERESDVLRLVAKGSSNQQISDELHITINTVKSHLRSILDKLQLDNRTQAATYALERGLTPDRKEEFTLRDEGG